MEKKEDLQENSENLNQKENSETDENLSKSDSEIKKEETKELTSEDKIKKLEDKVARTMAEMENQRRRFEKEKEDAFEYGGFAFAKESLNLLDNLERSKVALETRNYLNNEGFCEIETPFLIKSTPTNRKLFLPRVLFAFVKNFFSSLL